MQTKLTLRLDNELIGSAKEYARSTNRSVSQIVANFFALLELSSKAGSVSAAETAEDVPAAVAELHGCLRGDKLGEQDYWDYLETKHS